VVSVNGFFSEVFTHVGQWGTHVDPPAHFIKGLRTVDQIDPKEMILPLVVVDVHQEVAKNPDYTLSLERLKQWETDHGQIPGGAFVALWTDWSKRWPNAAKMENKDANGVAHYPGWSLPALKFLYEARKITASGHETADTDPGIATTKDDYSLETYILSTNHYQIELLTNLDQVPESGALLVVSFPKPKGGSGFSSTRVRYFTLEIGLTGSAPGSNRNADGLVDGARRTSRLRRRGNGNIAARSRRAS
jgi:kynurenine formamidase